MTFEDKYIHQNVNLKIVLVAALISIVGMKLVDVSGSWLTPWSTMAAGLGIALVTTGLTGIASEVIVRRQVGRELIIGMRLRGEIEQAGIERMTRFLDVDWPTFWSK